MLSQATLNGFMPTVKKQSVAAQKKSISTDQQKFQLCKNEIFSTP
jgi:hypothetical protein